MPKVTELYRHPVKSFTPEPRGQLRVVDGRIAGDRVLAFRFADKGPADNWAWQKKHNYVALVNTPGLALLELEFDDESRRLSLNYHGESFAEGSIDSEEDRRDLSEAVGEYVTSLDINPLAGHPERVPLKLIGDGRQGVFHDSEAGEVTLYSTESLEAFESEVTTDTGTSVDGRRFRANVVIDDVEAWEELSWTGRLTIGDGEYQVVKPVTRCLATHANPASGERDMQVMDHLVSANGIAAPTFAIRLESVHPEIETSINLGDPVVVAQPASR
ncbi:MAG: MOSC domain-containing protein [Dehalococcoidia bacterium]|jgi:hypothetical protein|nr:MOSC domain-containing protein [Dehalococcoidia bacterium]